MTILYSKTRHGFLKSFVAKRTQENAETVPVVTYDPGEALTFVDGKSLESELATFAKWMGVPAPTSLLPYEEWTTMGLLAADESAKLPPPPCEVPVSA